HHKCEKNTRNDDLPAEKQESLSRPRRPFNGKTLSRWVVWRSGRVECVLFAGFRGGTHVHPAAEHSSAPSTHDKERLHFLFFSPLSHSFIPEFTVSKTPRFREISNEKISAGAAFKLWFKCLCTLDFYVQSIRFDSAFAVTAAPPALGITHRGRPYR
ncbi:hypothetical protein Y032_1050g3493, partial [Ancylostoma ceylanicum]